jgi:small subunit ribosomal protein S6
MNQYEFVYIVDAHAAQSVKDDIAKQVQDALNKSGIKLVNSQVWIERQKMAFAINKISEGTYFLLNLEAPAPAMAKFNTLLRINDSILRYLTIALEPAKAAA